MADAAAGSHAIVALVVDPDSYLMARSPRKPFLYFAIEDGVQRAV